MDEISLRYIEVISFIVTASGALYFGYIQKKINEKQISINKKLVELQDYVAVSLVPFAVGEKKIKVMNVGKINLYLKKYEIGSSTETFNDELLIPAGSNPFLIIQLKDVEDNKKNPVKLYLKDEFNKKYIAKGEVIVEYIQVNTIQHDIQYNPDGTSNIKQLPKTITVPQVSAWAYKMTKYDWKL